MPIEQKILKSPETVTDPVVQKQKLFRHIAETFPEYRDIANHAEIDPIGLVFQHSVADGLELAKKLGLTPEEIRKRTIENPVFGLSHSKVILYVNTDLVGTEAQNKPGAIQLKNILNHIADGKFTSTSSEESQKARTFFQASFEKRKQDIQQFPREIIDSIAGYYAEFLPYRADELRKSYEEANPRHSGELTPFGKLTMHLEQGKKALFPKYMKALAKEVYENHSTEDPREVLEQLGVPKDEVIFMEASVDEYRSHETGEPLPTLVMNHGAGGKQNFNLEAMRKPVAKIREKLLTKELTIGAEELLNGRMHTGSHERHAIVYDENLKEHICTKQETVIPSQEEIQGQLYKIKEFFQQFEIIAKKHNLFNEKTRNMSYDELSDYITKAQEMNPEFEAELKAIDSEKFNDLHSVDLCEYVKVYDDLSFPELKRGLEYNVVHERIKDDFLAGIAEYLANVIDKKQPSLLTDKDLGELWNEFEEATKNYFSANYNGGDLEGKKLNDTLTQLDCLKHQDLNHLINYFQPKSGQERLEDIEKKHKETRTLIERSKRLFDAIKSSMKDRAKWLLESFTMPAKPDQNEMRLADQLTAACYPEEWSAYQEKIRKEQEYRDQQQSISMSEFSNRGLTENSFDSRMSGGNVGDKESIEQMKSFEAKFDQPVSAMLVTNVVGYDSARGIWRRMHVPVDGDMHQGRSMQKVSAQLTSPINSHTSVIPTPLGAMEVTSNKKIVEKDSLGVYTTTGNEAFNSWSYEVPLGDIAIEDVSDQTYTRFLDRFIDEGGKNYIEKIPGLPPESMMFLDSIKNLWPRDRMMQIQKFVTKHSFYDAYDNTMRNDMNNGTPAGRVAMMQERLSQLREELSDQVPDDKLFAGVCADFAVVGEMMLRESGIAAGAAEGYQVSGTTLNNNNAHGLNVAFWPDESGKTIMAQIDMTPGATTAEQQAVYLAQGLKPKPIEESIQDAEKREEEHIAELRERADDLLKEMEELLESGGKQATMELRRNLTEYISALCSLEDVFVYKRMIESYRFTPVQSADANDLSQKIAGITFMQGEHKRWKDEYNKRDDGLERLSSPGKNLMGEIDRLMIKAKMAGQGESFTRMVHDIPEYLAKELSEPQKKLWQLIGTYVDHR